MLVRVHSFLPPPWLAAGLLRQYHGRKSQKASEATSGGVASQPSYAGLEMGRLPQQCRGDLSGVWGLRRQCWPCVFPVSRASSGLGHLCGWQGPSRKGGSVQGGRSTGVNRSCDQQTELGLLLPPGMLGSRTATLLRKTQGSGIPPSLLSSAIFSELGISGRPQHPRTGSALCPSHPVSLAASTFRVRPPPAHGWSETSCGACPQHGRWHLRCSGHSTLGEGVHPE